MTDVFISYARSDRKRVRLIALGLAAEGFSVWWDPEIKPGAKWNDAIRKSLDNAAAVITCWSPDAVKSRWVVAETTHASNKNNLVPCTVRACHPPIPFNMIHAADLSHWKGDADDADWVLLLRQVRRLVEAKRRGAVAAPPPGEAEAARAADTTPGRYTRSTTRGRLGPRLSQFVLGAVVIGAVLTAGLWAMDRQFYTPAPPSPPQQEPVIEASVSPTPEQRVPTPTEAPREPPPSSETPAPQEASAPANPPPTATPQQQATPLVEEPGKPPVTPASTPPAETSNPFGDFLAGILGELARQRNEAPQNQTVIVGDTQGALNRDLDQCLTDMARACTYYPPDGYPSAFAVDGSFSGSEHTLLSTREFPQPGQATQSNLNHCRGAIRQGQGAAEPSTPLARACRDASTRRMPVIR